MEKKRPLSGALWGLSVSLSFVCLFMSNCVLHFFPFFCGGRDSEGGDGFSYDDNGTHAGVYGQGVPGSLEQAFFRN